ncbi:MAG: amino acid permease [Acidobacteria bacterium]|nr:amino acid permease [Acidobacteriota bacterium]
MSFSQRSRATLAAQPLPESSQNLQKTAGWVHLWALGVGGVISGNFFGWQTGLLTGGFGGLFLATLLIAAMYVCLVFSIAELSAALPSAGGFYNFTRSAFGKDRAFLNGLTDAIEYVTTPAVIVAGIAGYMKALAPSTAEWVWWVAFYCVFVFINVKGAALTFRVSMAITALAAAVLVFFYVSAIASGSFSWSHALNIAPTVPGGSAFLPHGWFGIFSALPYAVWFYLAIEQLPLSAEESHDAARDMPRALKWGMATLLGLSLCTLVLNSGVGPGAQGVGASNSPLETGFRAVFPSNMTSAALSIISLTGLIASFHSIIYAYGRLLFSLSRSGYLPAALGHVGRWRTPDTALLFGGALGLGLCFLAQRYSASVGAALLNMAVFGALLSYILVLLSFIRLRVDSPLLARPYRSPLGIPGALAGITLALICLAATFAVPSFRPGVTGAAVFIAVMLAYYWLYRRRHVEAHETSTRPSHTS